jgi:ABC-type glucose/galactose transport system permease subunit
MNSIKFNILWSTAVKVITIISYAIILSPLFFLLGISIMPITLVIFLIFLSLVPLLSGFIYAYFNAPKFLELTESQLIVHKRKGRKNISYDQISETRIYKPDKSDIRTFGVGGLFGFFGDYKNAVIGNYQAFVGDFNQAFLIKTKDGKNDVISCENREAAMEIIAKNIKI